MPRMNQILLDSQLVFVLHVLTWRSFHAIIKCLQKSWDGIAMATEHEATRHGSIFDNK
jgi:hypothetical protein